jgi:integral membrane protein (TIGR01906 family)
MVPLLLIMSAIRLLLFPIYLDIEYHTPNFPQDTYPPNPFTLQDRLHWSKISMEYLLNDQGISFLADQRLSDGTPLYNERELSHMVDVKRVVQGMLKALTIGLASLLLLGIWAWRGGWLNLFRQGLANGGWLAVAAVLAILVAVVLSFSTLFTSFHRLFFSGDSWIFLYTDSLIRTFPIRFWQDCFIYMGVLTMAGGLALGLLARPRKAK